MLDPVVPPSANEPLSAPDTLVPADTQAAAKEHVDEAHQILKRLRLSIHDHPELDLAIERLEEALAALNLQTGGML
jgi:hypothetical protein